MTAPPTPADRGKNHCGGRKRDGSGGTCTRPAGWGTAHVGAGRCKLHGGNTPSHKQAGERALAQAAVGTFGLPREIDPRDALLEEVYRTAGAVDWLWTRVRELEPEAVVWGLTERSDEGEKHKAVPNIWYDLWAKERRHLTEVCRVALQAGLDERKVKLAEQQGALLAGVIQAILGDLNLTAEQQRMVPTVVPRHLRLVG
jgi:hypothetical protein